MILFANQRKNISNFCLISNCVICLLQKIGVWGVVREQLPAKCTVT